MSPKVGDYIYNSFNGCTKLIGHFALLVGLCLVTQHFRPLPWHLYLLWSDLYYLAGTWWVFLIIRPILERYLPTEDEDYPDDADHESAPPVN